MPGRSTTISRRYSFGIYPPRISSLISSASSSDLLGHDEMRFARTSVIGTNASFQFVSTQDAVSFGDLPFAMDPLRLNGVEPGAFRGQQTRQDAHTPPCLLDGLIVAVDPGANSLTLVPRGVVPDQ